MKPECINNKYVLYARKSTDTDDKQMQSLDDQVRIMTEIAHRNGLQVIKIIRESMSAKKPDVRPGFAELTKLIEDGEANGIICWAVNRLFRNPVDGGKIQWMLQNEAIKHILTNDKSYYPEDNAIILSVEAGMSTQYVRELSRMTKRGMISKAEKGVAPYVAPLGYLNDKENKTIIKDEERFDSVRILWEKMLTGTYTIKELVSYANDILGLKTVSRKKIGGNPIKYSTLCEMFKNPFYTGKFRYAGKIYNGQHPPMVSDEEFKRVQSIINPHSTKPVIEEQKDFLFNGLMKCGKCGFAITMEEKFKNIRSTGERKRYVYYHCTGKNKQIKCDQPHRHINEDSLLEQLSKEVAKYTICPEFYELALEVIEQDEDKRAKINEKIIRDREKKLEKIDNSIKRLKKMRYSGEADDDEWYFGELEILKQEKEQLEYNGNDPVYEKKDWKKIARDSFSLARYAKEDFLKDDRESKRTIISKLSEKIEILDRTVIFTPVKYLVPILKMNEKMEQAKDLARTNEIDPQKQGSDNKNGHTRGVVYPFWLPTIREVITMIQDDCYGVNTDNETNE